MNSRAAEVQVYIFFCTLVVDHFEATSGCWPVIVDSHAGCIVMIVDVAE
jgi:hypothetical protein